MISSIIMKEHPFVLKDDKDSNPEDQTVFYLVPKTVRSQNDTAARYAGVYKSDKKTGEQTVNKKRLNVVDDEEWGDAVQRITNFIIHPAAPEGVYDYFFNLIEIGGASHLSKIETKEDDNGVSKPVTLIKVIETTDDEELRRIRLAMDPKHVSEVMDAYYDYAQLTGAGKND